MGQIVLCPQCTNELPANANFCHNCGAQVDDAATRRMESPNIAPPRVSKKQISSFESIDDARFVPGTILADRYRIVGLLGKGGMGEVYRADDLKLSQPVALKFLPLKFLSDGAALARFHREVRVARQVSHRNVCRVYDIGEIDGHHYLSMEYIKGEELSSLMRRIGRLPADKALQIARQLCAGLSAAHESGILHRDLKPSNVMIDNDGNARITDFGLAGLAEEFREDEMAAGTPAYMAPEQFDGQSLTIRSDIYSLGLLLYELFTGKRAFNASTLHELIQQRRSAHTPTTPTSIVPDLDPVIARVIERCLEKDPTRRPGSALQVAAAMPGGDPLAAALAAGETPSPEMVAAAPKKGVLRPPVALSLFVAFIFLLLGAMWLSRYGGLHRMVPLPKTPDVLTEQATQIVSSFGYNANADRAVSFDYDRDLVRYLEQNTGLPNTAALLRRNQPALIHYWYRQSPHAILPFSTQFVAFKDPPNEIPGMVRLRLDSEGRLIYFDGVPDQFRRQTVPNERSNDQNQSFESLFRFAGLDISKFREVASEWTPPRAYEVRRAWSGTYPQFPEIPLRIEAATFQGRPVYFELIGPWSKPLSEPWQPTATQRLGTWILLGFFFVTLILAALLAVHNLQNGRGDKRGALRIALFLFGLRMVYWTLTTHHVPNTDEFFLLVTTGLQSALFWSSFVGLMYLALEPYLRRRWPEKIISWSRLVAGDFRDPMIGRDVLIGGVLGMAAVAIMHLRAAVPVFMQISFLPEIPEIFETPMTGISAFSLLFLNQVSASLVQGLMLVFLFLILSVVFRKDWLGLLVGTLLLTSLFVVPTLGREPLLSQILVFSVVLILVFTVLRYGPLAVMTCLVIFHLWVFFPVTNELSAWYATMFTVDAVLLLALVGFGYYISLGGQPMFSSKLLPDEQAPK